MTTHDGGPEPTLMVDTVASEQDVDIEDRVRDGRRVPPTPARRTILRARTTS